MASLKKLSSTKAFGCTIARYQHISTHLSNLPAKFSIIFPPSSSSSSKSSSLLLWLSGLTCTDDNFITKSGAARLVATYNLPVLCPDTSPRGSNAPHEDDSYDFGTGASYYVDATTPGYEAYQMRSYILHDLLPLVRQSMLPFTERVAVSGHSMGGMGALQLALNSPHVFHSVSAFAPIVHPCAAPWGRNAFEKYLGKDETDWMQYDPCHVVAQVGSVFQDILVHQGSNDEFANDQLMTQQFVQACAKTNQKLTLVMAHGYDHSYFFVQTFLEQHFQFHAKALATP